MTGLSFFDIALDVAFPPRCVACSRSTVDCELPRDFCVDCQADLSLFNEPVCKRCAQPLASAVPSEQGDCPLCRDESWAFDETIALGAYNGLLRHLVLLGKRRAGSAGASALGRLLAEQHGQRLTAIGPCAVVSVPLHWRRRWARRADGVGQLAEALAQGLGVPCKPLLSRSRATPHQTSVAPSDRASNVRRAFRATIAKRLQAKTVLLVDDVLTTGATCHAAAKELKRAGAGRVVAVVAARRVSRL